MAREADPRLTPAMVTAGVRSYLSWNHQEDSPDAIVTEIFSAMRDAALAIPAQVFESPPSSGA